MKLIELLESFPMDPEKTHTVKVNGATIQYYVNDEKQLVTLYSIRVPQTKRKQGIASNAMQAFLNEVDKLGYSVELIASPLDKKTGTQGLIKLYQKFGFKLTGKSANLAGDPWMIR